MADSNTNINSESPALAKAAADSAKMANRIFIFGLLAVIISPSLAGFVLGIIALVLFEKNKKIVTRFKKASAGKILGGIGLFLSVLLLLYELLIMPVKNPPAWLKAIRDAFYTSAFYADFENNFITDNRISYIFKGLVITFEVTFFAALLGIALGVIVALIRSSYDTTKEELRPGFGKAVLFCLNKICGIYLTVIRGTPVVVQLMITYFVIFASSNTVRSA